MVEVLLLMPSIPAPTTDSHPRFRRLDPVIRDSFRRKFRTFFRPWPMAGFACQLLGFRGSSLALLAPQPPLGRLRGLTLLAPQPPSANVPDKHRPDHRS